VAQQLGRQPFSRLSSLASFSSERESAMKLELKEIIDHFADLMV
jgi:hypothetical protein